jgi:predicted dinucleotide-binding enzyme
VKIGVIGAGRIGGNCAAQAVKSGHEVMVSFARDRSKLEAMASELGPRASVGDPREAAQFADLVILSVPWGVIPDALEQAGALAGKIVVDTTNQFGPGPKPAEGQTAASFNAARMPGARYTKSFNTLTSAFQAEAAQRDGDQRVVQWMAGDESEAKQALARLIEDMGYVPVDLGSIETCQVMEAPRRPGAVYGEEYRAADAQAVVDAVARGEEIPPTPSY